MNTEMNTPVNDNQVTKIRINRLKEKIINEGENLIKENSNNVSTTQPLGFKPINRDEIM